MLFWAYLVISFPLAFAWTDQQQDPLPEINSNLGSYEPSRGQLGTTIIYGTTLATSRFRPENTQIPSACAGIPGAEIDELDVSDGYIFATYRTTQPTTFVLPLSSAPWHVQFRTITISGHSGVMINYRDPYLSPITAPTPSPGDYLRTSDPSSSEDPQHVTTSENSMVRWSDFSLWSSVPHGV